MAEDPALERTKEGTKRAGGELDAGVSCRRALTLCQGPGMGKPWLAGSPPGGPGPKGQHGAGVGKPYSEGWRDGGLEGHVLAAHQAHQTVARLSMNKW